MFLSHILWWKRAKKVYNVELNLWSPEELPPEEEKSAEIGGNYFYLYNPEEVSIDSDQNNRIVEFTFHPSLKKRYQFRWLTSDYPQYVTLQKKTKRKTKKKTTRKRKTK